MIQNAGPSKTSSGTNANPLLEMTGISKRYPGVIALDDVYLCLQRGEVVALVGENGAGKSTLMKVLGGAVQPDGGTIAIEGRHAQISNPVAARHLGIAIIYQEFNLLPALPVYENIFLGQEKSWGLLRKRDERKRAREICEWMGVSLDVDTPCRQLNVAQQQVVEIARALTLDARVIVMDEPSATLTPKEVERLFAIIDDLKKRDIGVIYISHRLDEVFRVADRIAVLRDGKNVIDAPRDDFDREKLIQSMVGRELKDEFPPREVALGNVRLEVTGLSDTAGKVDDVSFSVRAGEVLGITGLVGAGRTELVRLVYGADRMASGDIKIDGHRADILDPAQALKSGVALLTEDRKTQGLVLGHSVRHNFGLPNLDWLSKRGILDKREERNRFGSFVDQLQIKIANQEQPAKSLSGGNQQKVLLARCVARNCRVIIFDEPTRGVDVGAKFEIYSLLNELAANGLAIIIVSSELPEILGMSDRILVMHEGRVTGEIEDVTAATQEQIMELAVK